MQAISPFSFCALPVETVTLDVEQLEDMTDLSVAELRHVLRTCERRLGTPAELPGDFDRARSLAHEINNRAQRDYLRAILNADTLTDLPLHARLVA